MNEEYVNEEITRKLIDKGCPVRLIIKADERIPILYELPKKHPDWQYCKAWYIPTISQVLKWLREEKKIHIAIGYSGETKWRYVVIHLDEAYFNNPNITKKRLDSYEEAALAGIEYVIKNLI